jgi:hypothetical protein
MPQDLAAIFRKDYELSAAQHAAGVQGKSEPQRPDESRTPRPEIPAFPIPNRFPVPRCLFASAPRSTL